MRFRSRCWGLGFGLAVGALGLAGCGGSEEADAAGASRAAVSRATRIPSPVAWTPTPFLRALPGGTVVYACARDAGALWDAAGRTGLGAILGEPEVQSVLGEVFAALEREVAGPVGEEGTAWLRELGAVRAEFAVVSVEAIDPRSLLDAPQTEAVDLAVALTEAGDPARWRQVLAFAADEAVRSGAVAVSRFEAAGWRFLELEGKGGRFLCGSSPAGWLVGTRRETLEAIAERWDGADEPGLAADPVFGRIRSYAGEAPALFAYLDVRGLARAVPLPEPAGRILEAAGLGAIQAIGYSAEVRDGRWIERARVEVPRGARGLLAAFFPSAGVGRDALRVVPERAVSASVGRFDARALWEGVGRIAAAFDPAAGQAFRQGIASFEARFGISLERDLVGALDGLVGSYAIPGPGGRQETVVFFDVRDGPRFRDTLERLVKGLGLPLEETEVGGSPAWAFAVPIPVPGTAGAPGGGPVKPCLVFAPKHCVLATSPGAAQGFLERVAEGGPSVLDRPDWDALAAHLPDAGCAISYADLGAGIRAVAAALQAMPRMPGTPRLPLDAGTSPLVGIFARRAGRILSVAAADADGIGVHAASSIGIVPAAATACAAAVGLPALRKVDALRAEREGGVGRALKGLVTAQERFRAKRGRYARALGELARAGLAPPELADGIHGGYLIRLQPGTEGRGWEAYARPIGGSGRAFYTDTSGVIRAEASGLAGAASPAAQAEGGP